jgi:quercetin dioxygenase-like cupin family protein
MRQLFLLGAALCLMTATAFAQDPVKVDPQHYQVVFENDRVRVLKFHYGPHEKSVMHSHPDAVVTFLSGGTAKFHMPDGTTQDQTMTAGESHWTPAGTHLPENVGDIAMEGVLVELKGHHGAHAETKAAPPPAQ